MAKCTVKRILIKDFKAVENLDMELDGKSLFLIGDNALGKSSIIQAVWACLSPGKNMPTQSIRKGAEKAEVQCVVKTATGEEYTCKLKVTPKGEYIEVISPDGFSTSKQANLEKIIGNIDFDVFEFIALGNSKPGKRQQVERLRAFLKPETLAVMDDCDNRIKEIKESRQFINKRLTEIKGLLSTLPAMDEAPAVIDIDTLTEEYQAANLRNLQLYNMKRDIEQITRNREIISDNTTKQLSKIDIQIKEHEAKIISLKAEAEELTKTTAERLLKINTELNQVQKAVDTFVPVDLTAIKAKIEVAKENNAKAAKFDEVNKLAIEREEREAKYKELGALVTETENKKKAALSGDTLPVEGLEFNDEGVFYNGLPFDESQLSTSELMRIGFQLAVASAPECRIIKVARGESLGAEARKELKNLCKKHGFQFFFEQVEPETKEVRYEIWDADTDETTEVK